MAGRSTELELERSTISKRDANLSNHDRNSDEALVFFEAFHRLLVFLALLLIALIGLHFQALDVSPLDAQFVIILLFVMAAIVHGIAYVEIKLLPQNAEYLPVLRFICLISGIITIELLVAISFLPFGYS